MTKYVRLKVDGTKVYPFTDEDYFRDFPHTSAGYSDLDSTPDYLLNELEIHYVEEVAPPDAEFNEVVEPTEPYLVEDGLFWREDWTVRAATEEELIEKQLALKDSITRQVQSRLDEFARTRDYDGILSAISYASSTNPKFAAEATYCLSARDATWTQMYVILEEVQTGVRELPTSFADIEADLPTLAWPQA